jgi:hypothetical protein
MEESTRKGCGMPITWGKDTFLLKFVLIWLPQDDWAEAGETFSGFKPEMGRPKTIL